MQRRIEGRKNLEKEIGTKKSCRKEGRLVFQKLERGINTKKLGPQRFEALWG
jgi:hypothetical protein